jgi:hypothetical protein
MKKTYTQFKNDCIIPSGLSICYEIENRLINEISSGAGDDAVHDGNTAAKRYHIYCDYPDGRRDYCFVNIDTPAPVDSDQEDWETQHLSNAVKV